MTQNALCHYVFLLRVIIYFESTKRVLTQLEDMILSRRVAPRYQTFFVICS